MRRLLPVAALLGLLAVPAIARAQESAEKKPVNDGPPDGKLALVGGLRSGTGALGDAFGLGYLWGVEASWQPMKEGQRIGYAVHWDVLFGGFGADAQAITGGLDILEMNLGVRLRLAPERGGRAIYLGGGGALLRSNEPLPPDDERSYYGGFGALGVEQLTGSLQISVELRYGLIGAGPGSISFMLGIGFGI